MCFDLVLSFYSRLTLIKLLPGTSSPLYSHTTNWNFFFTYVDNDLKHVQFIIKRLTFDIFDDDDEEEEDFDYDDMK